MCQPPSVCDFNTVYSGIVQGFPASLAEELHLHGRFRREEAFAGEIFAPGRKGSRPRRSRARQETTYRGRGRRRRSTCRRFVRNTTWTCHLAAPGAKLAGSGQLDTRFPSLRRRYSIPAWTKPGWGTISSWRVQS